MLNNLFDAGGDWILAFAGMTEVVDLEGLRALA